MIGVAQMMLQSDFERRQGLFVNAENQLFGGWSRENFVKEDFEVAVRNGFEAERRFAHFANALANGGSVFGAEGGMKAEGHFEFVKRFAGDARGENLVKGFETIMVALW